MDEGSKTALAFLGIFVFLGLAIFFPADIGELDSISENSVVANNDSQQSDSEQVEASTRYTDSFESELGPEYVFDIETRSIERLRTENGRDYYQASLSFELTEFGERIAEAESEEEVRSIVESSFEDYPDGDFEEALMNDVRMVEQGEPHRLESEALQGRIENIESSDQGVDLSVSVEEGLSPKVKWGKLLDCLDDEYGSF